MHIKFRLAACVVYTTMSINVEIVCDLKRIFVPSVTIKYNQPWLQQADIYWIDKY